MAKRTTRVMLEVKWDDELIDHPGAWDWPGLVASSPFEPDTDTKMLSFQDFDDEGNVEQV